MQSSALCFICELATGLGHMDFCKACKGSVDFILLHTPQSNADLQTCLVPYVAEQGTMVGQKTEYAHFYYFLKCVSSSITLLSYIIAVLVFIIIVWLVLTSNYRLIYVSIQSCEHCA